MSENEVKTSHEEAVRKALIEAASYRNSSGNLDLDFVNATYTLAQAYDRARNEF